MAAESTRVLVPQTTESTDSHPGGHYVSAGWALLWSPRLNSSRLLRCPQGCGQPALVTLGLRRFPFVHYSASATICPLTVCPLAPHVCLFLPLFMRCYSELHSIGTATCWTSSLLYNSLQIAVTRNEIPPLSFPTSRSPSQPLVPPDPLHICC